MEKHKQDLSSAATLQFPNLAKPFVANADASGFALGPALQQDFDNGLQAIAYEGRKLNVTERRYSTYKREFLSIAYSCRT